MSRSHDSKGWVARVLAWYGLGDLRIMDRLKRLGKASDEDSRMGRPQTSRRRKARGAPIHEVLAGPTVRSFEPDCEISVEQEGPSDTLLGTLE